MIHLWMRGLRAKLGRQGREAIDQANEIYEYSSNSLEETNKIKIVDTVDAVNKLFDGTSKMRES